MKYGNIKLILALSLSPLAAFTQAGDFKIEGKVNPGYNGSYVKLYVSQNDKQVVDTFQVKGGRFKFHGTVPQPLLATISMNKMGIGDRTPVFLSSGTVRVITQDSLKNAVISGTKLAEEQHILSRSLSLDEEKLSRMIHALDRLPAGNQKKAYTQEMMETIKEVTVKRVHTINEFVKKHPNSYVSLYHLINNVKNRSITKNAALPYFEKLSEKLKDTPTGKQFRKELLGIKLMEGKSYIDFASTTPDGETLSLKEVISKNRYVLLDFWASWCGPCRSENPNVLKTFTDFKGAGFTVMSVSLDDNSDKWKAAIKADGMPWYHVSRLQRWNEPAAKLYGIQAIPENLLIDHEGKIIASNLVGDALYKKILELIK